MLGVQACKSGKLGTCSFRLWQPASSGGSRPLYGQSKRHEDICSYQDLCLGGLCIRQSLAHAGTGLCAGEEMSVSTIILQTWADAEYMAEHSRSRTFFTIVFIFS